LIALQINGKRVELDHPTPLLAYLEQLGVNPRAVAVEHNGEIIERASFASVTLRDDDHVEIVRMVGGGCPTYFLALIAASASALSSHGSDPRAVRIDRSCPLPASRTVSPGLASSIARRMAARLSITIS
jgi:thiamine biosynthesis protein ThiS